MGVSAWWLSGGGRLRDMVVDRLGAGGSRGPQRPCRQRQATKASLRTTQLLLEPRVLEPRAPATLLPHLLSYPRSHPGGGGGARCSGTSPPTWLPGIPVPAPCHVGEGPASTQLRGPAVSCCNGEWGWGWGLSLSPPACPGAQGWGSLQPVSPSLESGTRRATSCGR